MSDPHVMDGCNMLRLCNCPEYADAIEALQSEAAAMRAEVARLRGAGAFLLRLVTGKALREKGIILQDTSNLDEFLAAIRGEGE